VSVAKFLFELICRFGCFATQINDQRREFVNAVSDELHVMRISNNLSNNINNTVTCLFNCLSLNTNVLILLL